MLLGVFDHEGPLAAADFHFDVAVFVREHVLPLEGELVGLAVGRADGLSSVVAPEHVVPEPLLFRVFIQVPVKFRNDNFFFFFFHLR